MIMQNTAKGLQAMMRKSRNFWVIWLHSSQKVLKTWILLSMAATHTPMMTEQVITASILLLLLRAEIILSGTALTMVTRMLLVVASVTPAASSSTTNS